MTEEDAESCAKGKGLSPKRRKELDQLVTLGGLKLLEKILNPNGTGQRRRTKVGSDRPAMRLTTRYRKNKRVG